MPGIQSTYIDALGRRRRAPRATVRAIEKVMDGVSVRSRSVRGRS